MVARGESPDTLVLCSHPPVVTVGRITPESDYVGWTGDLVEVSRGGRATYHGPNQIVVYPVISLNRVRAHLPARDLHTYLRLLGKAIVLSAKDFGLEAEYKQGKVPVNIPGSTALPDAIDGTPSRHITGVWVGERKLASIGVAARQWVTFHGLALNVSSGEEGFWRIQPCGFSPSTMTSMEEALGLKINREEVEIKLTRHLKEVLSI